MPRAREATDPAAPRGPLKHPDGGFVLSRGQSRAIVNPRPRLLLLGRSAIVGRHGEPGNPGESAAAAKRPCTSRRGAARGDCGPAVTTADGVAPSYYALRVCPLADAPRWWTSARAISWQAPAAIQAILAGRGRIEVTDATPSAFARPLCARSATPTR
jgi:hypothetical protein